MCICIDVVGWLYIESTLHSFFSQDCVFVEERAASIHILCTIYNTTSHYDILHTLYMQSYDPYD